MKLFWFTFVPDDLTLRAAFYVYVCDSYLNGLCSWGLLSTQNSLPHTPCECACCLFEPLLCFWRRQAEAITSASLCSTSEERFSVSYIILKLEEMWVEFQVLCPVEKKQNKHPEVLAQGVRVTSLLQIIFTFRSWLWTCRRGQTLHLSQWQHFNLRRRPLCGFLVRWRSVTCSEPQNDTTDFWELCELYGDPAVRWVPLHVPAWCCCLYVK